MKKNNLKQLCLVFCFLASKSAFSYDFTAKNADNVTIYYNYINEGKELEVTNNGDYYNTKNSYKGNVKIPETVTINGRERKVTSIGEYAFRYCSGLTSITIPNSVTRIGNEAFVGTGLTSVHISDLAAWCKISFNDNPLSYAHHLFLNGQEIKDLVIPNSVTSIGDFAFYSCSGLTSVTIGNSVTSIGNYAFMNCSGLKSVTIPNSVTSIGSRAFNFTNSNNDVLVEIISLIENPSEKVQLAAFEKNVQAILYVKGGPCNALVDALNAVSEEAMAAAVKADPNILKFVRNPELLRAAVREDWKVVRQIKDAGDDLWAEAVRVSADALKYVSNPGEKVMLAALERDWKLLQDIERPSAAMVAVAVKQDYHALEFVSIKRRTEPVQLAAVHADPRCIQFLERASEAVQMEAVRGDKSVFALIKHPAPAVVEFCK